MYSNGRSTDSAVALQDVLSMLDFHSNTIKEKKKMKNTTTTTTTTVNATTTTTAKGLPLSFQEFRNLVIDGVTEFYVGDNTWTIGVPEDIDGIRKYAPYTTADSRQWQAMPPSGLKKVYDNFRQMVSTDVYHNHIYNDFCEQFEKMKLEHKAFYTIQIGLNSCSKCSRLLLAEVFRGIARKMKAEGCNIRHGMVRSTFYHFCTVETDTGKLNVHFYTSAERYNKAVKDTADDVFNFISKFDK